MTPQGHVLQPLLKVRVRREETTQRSLQAASAQALLARQQLQRCTDARRAIELGIASTLARPYDAARSAAADVRDFQLGLRRVDLLREQLVKAQSQERAAQAELAQREAQREAALKLHLLARHKREAVADQLRTERRVTAATHEKAALEAAQERGVLAQHRMP